MLMINIFIVTLIGITVSLPFSDQVALVNSLQVGRKEDPMVWQCQGCSAQNKPINSYLIEDTASDVRMIMSIYNDYTVLAFRYTATAQNLFQDILYAIQKQDQNACKGCKVQKQYDRMWGTIRKDTINGLKKHDHTKRLIITGISLGGGLASISFVDIKKQNIFDHIEVVTFGAPRIGNKAWAEWFDKQTPSRRFFIKGDPIVLFPRCITLLCNYKQQGIAIECNKKTEICTTSTSKTHYMSSIVNGIKELTQDYVAKKNSPDLGSIIDHIFGYKKIRDYTLIQ